MTRHPAPRSSRLAAWLAAAVLAAAGLAGCGPSAQSAVPQASGESTGPRLEELPRIPWEGGAAYWKRFAKADRAGWSDPSFFPIVAWYNGISSDAEVQFDKKLGINTYIGMADTTEARLFDQNGVFWIGSKLNGSFTAQSPGWVGYFLDDEVDGRFTPEEGRKHLADRAAQVPEGLFSYTNFTQMVISKDLGQQDAERFVNDFADTVSTDMYWYTIPHCSQEPYRDALLVPVQQSNCRTASSYGKAMEALRLRDAADGKLQPLWQFVENLYGGPADLPFQGYIEPDELRGAVMNSVINEARGIVYFNQSFAGPCQGSNVFRLAQVTKDYCGAAQVAAAGEVNAQIHALAPVINTQSYEYSFGPGLDTMLKAKDGYAYIFAMPDGASQPGERAFRLPEGITGERAEVLYEDRTVPVGDGRFTDRFDHEHSYHIYKVRL